MFRNGNLEYFLIESAKNLIFFKELTDKGGDIWKKKRRNQEIIDKHSDHFLNISERIFLVIAVLRAVQEELYDRNLYPAELSAKNFEVDLTYRNHPKVTIGSLSNHISNDSSLKTLHAFSLGKIVAQILTNFSICFFPKENDSTDNDEQIYSFRIESQNRSISKYYSTQSETNTLLKAQQLMAKNDIEQIFSRGIDLENQVNGKEIINHVKSMITPVIHNPPSLAKTIHFFESLRFRGASSEEKYTFSVARRTYLDLQNTGINYLQMINIINDAILKIAPHTIPEFVHTLGMPLFFSCNTPEDIVNTLKKLNKIYKAKFASYEHIAFMWPHFKEKVTPLFTEMKMPNNLDSIASFIYQVDKLFKEYENRDKRIRSAIINVIEEFLDIPLIAQKELISPSTDKMFFINYQIVIEKCKQSDYFNLSHLLMNSNEDDYIVGLLFRAIANLEKYVTEKVTKKLSLEKLLDYQQKQDALYICDMELIRLGEEKSTPLLLQKIAGFAELKTKIQNCKEESVGSIATSVADFMLCAKQQSSYCFKKASEIKEDYFEHNKLSILFNQHRIFGFFNTTSADTLEKLKQLPNPVNLVNKYKNNFVLKL